MIKLVQLDTCESTNDEAWKHLPETTLVVTRHQTRGRGRQGRRWEDDAGSIMASLALVPPPGFEPHVTLVPLAAGVSASEAISLASAGAALSGLRLKWPNDLMWQDAKMGGILCESRLSGEKISGIVIGFGLNLTNSPDIAGVKTTALAHHLPTDADHSDHIGELRNRILGAWAERVQFWIEEIAQGRSARLREDWLKYAKLDRFSSLAVHDRSGNVVKLKALGIDESGRLKAQLQDSAKIVYIDQAE